MQTIELYRYEREDGGVTISPVKPDVEYTIMYRLVADEGKILVNGDKTTACIDTDSIDGWEEIDYAEEEATDADYQEALENLGVNFDE
jgi:hypothetical protein